MSETRSSEVSIERPASSLQAISSEKQEQLLLALAIAAAVSIHISIALCQILLGVGIAAMLLLRRRLPFPRIWIPLLCFLLWTIAADALSGDAWGGRAQIRKFYDFLFIPLLYGVFREQFVRARVLLLGWIAAATASGAWGLVQYVLKYEQAKRTGKDFYVAYLERRITGFESHWMTFGALQLSVLSLLLAHFFFARRRFPNWVYASAGLFAATIVLGWTRGIWVASIPALVYLVGAWRPKMVLLIPVVFAIAFALAPSTTRDRLTSLVAPHGDTDSNRHRIVTFRTGVQMIKAHPWFGIGPEEIGRQFNAYVPTDVRRPLPVGYYGHLHNIYVQYAAERGLPGLACVLCVVGLAVWDWVGALVQLRGKTSLEGAVLHGAIAVTIGMMVGGLFEYNLGDSEVLMMFTAVLGLGYAAAAQTERIAPQV